MGSCSSIRFEHADFSFVFPASQTIQLETVRYTSVHVNSYVTMIPGQHKGNFMLYLCLYLCFRVAAVFTTLYT